MVMSSLSSSSPADPALPAAGAACVAGLAYYLSQKRAPERSMELKAIYEEEFRRAADQDEDRASFRVRPYPGVRR